MELAESNIFKPQKYRRIKSDFSNQGKDTPKDLYKDTAKHVVYRIENHVLLCLIVIIILKRLIVKLKRGLFNGYIITL